MLRFQENIDLRGDIRPSIMSICGWGPEAFKDTVYDVPLTKGQYDNMVRDCEAEIIFEHLEGMFGITPESFNYEELIKHPFFTKLSLDDKDYYLDIIVSVIDKYNTIENTVDLFYSYKDEESFDYDYDLDPVPEGCVFVASDEDEDEDDDDV